jgi:hypothetical protein
MVEDSIQIWRLVKICLRLIRNSRLSVIILTAAFRSEAACYVYHPVQDRQSRLIARYLGICEYRQSLKVATMRQAQLVFVFSLKQNYFTIRV